MNQNFKKYLLELTQSSDCEEQEMIQELWSGYGKISRYQLVDPGFQTVVVKHIALGKVPEHPRGWNTEVSQQRKVKSYEVETNWYANWSKFTDENCRIPEFIGSFKEGKNQWIVLEDLDENYAFRKNQLAVEEVKVVLKWLANFHGKFMHHEPKGLWKSGTYWHLATRQDELNKIEYPALKVNAQLIDDRLSCCQFQTIVHGDAKLANFCFSLDGKEVAAVDFQYVGSGCGMKDVAYFLGSCLSSSELEELEEELLNFYFESLRIAASAEVGLNQLEQEWRELYPFAVADFTRFMLGWMPSHQKINSYSLKKVEEVLGGF